MHASETRIPPLCAVVAAAGLGVVSELGVVDRGEGVLSSIVRVSKEKSVIDGGDSKSKNIEIDSARSRSCVVSEFEPLELSMSV
jgi:hypothetical protein